MAQDQTGIMSLPQQQGGQDPTLTLDDSYGVMSDALKNASPEASQIVDTTLDSIVPQLDQLSDEELDIFIQMVQKLYDEPENYAENRANLISGGNLDEEDLPPEYDPDALSTMLLVLLRARDQRTKAGTAPETAPQGAMPEMPMAAMAPPGMLPPQQFARGGIVEAVRMVASSGRNGDTMLAHITPKEARLLRKHGGSGTVNPVTGLYEFGFFSFIKKAWKAVWKPVKKVLNSPIGRLVVNVAATVVLGPVLGPAVASGLTTAAQGGDWKDILRSSVTAAATSYLAGPTSPIAGPMNSIGNALGITSAIGQQALRSGLVNAGAGLLQGQSLKDSVKTGLISAGTVAASQLASQAMSGTKGAESAPPIEDRTLPGMPSSQQGQLAPALAGPAPGMSTTPAGAIDQFSLQRVGGSSVAAPVVSNANVSTATPVPIQTTPGGAVSSTSGAVPTVGESFSTMGTGVKQMFGAEPGGFMKGLSTLGEGAENLFMPGSPTTAQVVNSPAYQSALAAKMSPADAFAVASKELSPGVMRTYGPAAAAGIGAMYLGGGFTPTPPESEMKNKMYGTPGLDLLNANPNKYLVQNLPGVQYDAQGRIIGQGGASNQPTMADVRVPSAYTDYPSYYAEGGMATPNAGVFAGRNNDFLQRLMIQRNASAAPGFMERLMAQRNASAAPGLMERLRQQKAANPQAYTPQMSQQTGIAALAQGGYPRRTGQISGPGTEKSDSIPAMLSDGEFVMTAKAVRGLGKGSRLEGAKRMYALMNQLERNASRG